MSTTFRLAWVVALLVLLDGARGVKVPDGQMVPLFEHRNLWSKSLLRMRQDANDSRQLQSIFNVCNSEFTEFTINSWAGVSLEDLQTLIDVGVDYMAFYYKSFIDKNEDGEYFGANGEYTDMVLARMKNIEAFWRLYDPTLESSSNPVTLLGVHGADIATADSLVALCSLFEQAGLFTSCAFSTCDDWAAKIDSYVQKLPGGYSSPFLTLNTQTFFPGATAPELLPFVGDDPRLILLGDGMLEFIDNSSVDSSLGMDFVLGHEFCHVIQSDIGVLDPVLFQNLPPDDKERLELMCDVFSVYYLAHEQGGNLSMDEVTLVVKHAMTFGDPIVDDTGGFMFHGTPGQRECAAVWAGTLAKSNGESVLTSTSLVEQFDAVFADIYDGNPSVCPGITSDVDCDSSTENGDGSNSLATSNTDGTSDTSDTAPASNGGASNTAPTSNDGTSDTLDTSVGIRRQGLLLTICLHVFGMVTMHVLSSSLNV